MNEMKTVSFWKSLEIVLGSARLPDAQMTNPWPIVKLEGVANVPAPRPSRPSNVTVSATTAPAGHDVAAAREGAIAVRLPARPPPLPVRAL